MARNSKTNRHHPTQDGDDYVYPTKKIRETKTRNRKRDKNLIKAGLIDQVCQDNADADDWYDDEPMSERDHDLEMVKDYNKMITEYNAMEEEIADLHDRRHKDLISQEYDEAINDIYGDNWDTEDY